MSDKQLTQSIEDGSAWEAFCDALKETGKQILREEAPSDAFSRAEGWRYLTRLTRIALDMFVECSDADFPTFYRPSHETAKIGADNPDNYYQRAEINGCYSYRISGSRGTVAYLGLIAIAGGYEDEDSNMVSVASLDTHGELKVSDDGKVDIWLSCDAPPADFTGNWMKITENTLAVLVRQTFLDRNTETIADLKIERVAEAGVKPAPLDPATLAVNLQKTAGFVQGTAKLFADWAQSFRDTPNQLPPSDQAYCQKIGGDPNIFYYHSYYELAEEEALVIEVERIPDCDNWNFQVDNYWMESLDYRYLKIHVNKHTAHYNDDGSVTIVVAESDPGHPNWLETAGHRQGTMAFRWIGATDIVHPTCRVVKLSELAQSA